MSRQLRRLLPVLLLLVASACAGPTDPDNGMMDEGDGDMDMMMSESFAG